MIHRHLMIGMSIGLFAGTTGCGANCYQPFSGAPIPGCHENVRGGAVGVGRGTTSTVVNSIVALIATDCLFTSVFYSLGW